MNSCLRLATVRRNIASVIAFARAAGANVDCRSGAYFTALQALQGHPYRIHTQREAFCLEFDVERAWVQPILQAAAASEADEAEATAPSSFTGFGASEQTAIARNLTAAMQMLREFEREVPSLVRELVGCLVVAKCAGYAGGSLGNVLGVVWISPQDGWRPVDYAEHLLHETVHQALFLDDMVNGLFTASPARMAQDDACITSPIRKIKRPFHAAFHAACVAAVLAGFYEQLDIQEKTLEFQRPARQTLAEMQERRHLLTAHGRSVFEALCDSVYPPAAQTSSPAGLRARDGR